MRTIARRLALLAAPILLGATACLPYTVGSTAETVPEGRTTTSTSYYFIPNAIKSPGDTVVTAMAGADMEWRHGMDERSDIGLRLTSGAGAVINYKRRFSDRGTGTPALAYMVGTGIVNGGNHLYLETTLIASGNEASTVMPFRDRKFNQSHGRLARRGTPCHESTCGPGGVVRPSAGVAGRPVGPARGRRPWHRTDVGPLRAPHGPDESAGARRATCRERGGARGSRSVVDSRPR